MTLKISSPYDIVIDIDSVQGIGNSKPDAFYVFPNKQALLPKNDINETSQRQQVTKSIIVVKMHCEKISF